MNTNIQYVIIAITILFSVFNINGQNIDLTSETQYIRTPIGANTEAQGTPYINKEFMPVKITQINDKIYSARYNAYNGEMEVLVDDNKIIALNNDEDFEILFTLEEKKYRTETYFSENKQVEKGFLVVIFENENYTLYKEERIKYYDKVKANSSYQEDKPARYELTSDNFYIKSNNEINYLPINKRAFLSFFTDKEKKLRKYMKEQKLNPKNEKELIKLIQYLSTL